MELFSPKKLLQALLCSYLLSAILLLATAFFLYRFRLKESQIRLAVAVIYVLSGALAGFFFARTTGKRRFFCGLSYFLILAAVSSFLGEGFTVSMPHLLTTMGMCIGGGIFGAVIS
mgnify:CR=1 FL=1